MSTVGFRVHGIPRPAGSKTPYPYKRKDGSTGVAITDASGPKGKEWRKMVAAAGREAWDGKPLLLSAVRMHVAITLPRPKAHYGTGRNAGTLKRGKAYQRHTSKPDALKLVRSVEDALSGVVYKDDAQVDIGSYTKSYGERPGVAVTLTWVQEDEERLSRK